MLFNYLAISRLLILLVGGLSLVQTTVLFHRNLKKIKNQHRKQIRSKNERNINSIHDGMLCIFSIKLRLICIIQGYNTCKSNFGEEHKHFTQPLHIQN